MINEHYTPEAVILANGEYPTCPVPLTMLEEASFVACCDGAANEYISRGHTPDVIVGDGDSLSTEYHKRFSPIIHQIPDQETNDQTKAVRYLQKRGFRRIAIVVRFLIGYLMYNRGEGRPYIGKYQPTAGLYEKRHGSTDHY